ncbi:putative quinol monooxygenase [Caulobacter segnis]|nr:putative quinol monooxygenase [Caulobacter segnis]
MTKEGPDRRGLIIGGVAATVLAPIAQAQEKTPMYGLIGQMLAAPGKRSELIAILSASVDAMPGCLSYVIAEDPSNADALWISEVWSDKDSHAASLKLPSVQAAIAKARPIIAGFPQHFETRPVGGYGLKA